MLVQPYILVLKGQQNAQTSIKQFHNFSYDYDKIALLVRLRNDRKVKKINYKSIGYDCKLLF